MCKDSNDSVARQANLSTLVRAAPPGRRVRGRGAREGAELVPGLKDSVAERPNHSNLCTSEFRQNSFRIQENFSELFRNSENFRKSQRFLEYSAKFREIFIKICANFVQNCRKKLFFAEIQRKIRKSLTNFCEDFEFGAVRRSVYLVDLEKR